MPSPIEDRANRIFMLQAICQATFLVPLKEPNSTRLKDSKMNMLFTCSGPRYRVVWARWVSWWKFIQVSMVLPLMGVTLTTIKCLVQVVSKIDHYWVYNVRQKDHALN